jgi:hypothetical protein
MQISSKRRQRITRISVSILGLGASRILADCRHVFPRFSRRIRASHGGNAKGLQSATGEEEARLVRFVVWRRMNSATLIRHARRPPVSVESRATYPSPPRIIASLPLRISLSVHTSRHVVPFLVPGFTLYLTFLVHSYFASKIHNHLYTRNEIFYNVHQSLLRLGLLDAMTRPTQNCHLPFQLLHALSHSLCGRSLPSREVAFRCDVDLKGKVFVFAGEYKEHREVGGEFAECFDKGAVRLNRTCIQCDPLGLRARD